MFGDWGKYDLEQRTLMYAGLEAHVTDDYNAGVIQRVQLIQAFDNREPFVHVLDVGCYDGFTTRWVVDQPHCKKLVGIDVCKDAINQAMVAIAKRRHPEKAVYKDLSWQEYFEFKNDEEVFDVVCLFEVLEHFTAEEGRILLARCWDRLSSGGRLFLSMPDPTLRYGYTNTDPHHIMLYTRVEVEELVLDLFHRRAVFHKVPEPSVMHFTIRKGPWTMYEFQTESCQGAITPILNAACKEDPADLGRKFDAINLDLLTYDPHTKRDLQGLHNFVQGDVFHLPWEDGTFGTVVLGEFIEHCTFDAAVRALSECRRVVKLSGGKIVLSFPLDSRSKEEQHIPEHLVEWCPGVMGWHITVWTDPMLAELFRQVRVREVSRQPLPYDFIRGTPPPQGWGIIVEKVPEA